MQAQQAEPRDLVGRVVEEAGGGDEVFDVRGLQEAQAPVLDVGHPPGRQLEFEQIAVVCGPHQHRLIVQAHAGLDAREHRVDDGPRLGGGVVAAQQAGPGAPGTGTAQDEPVPVLGWADGIRKIEHALPGAEVSLEADHRSPREGGRDVVQVRGIGPAEAVDRLRVVADDGQAAAARAHQGHDVDLQRVHVLVLVDEHVVESGGDAGADDGVRQQGAPAQQQIVEVEQTMRALASRVGTEQVRDGVHARLYPGEVVGEHLTQRPAGVDAAGVDIDEGGRPRQPDGGGGWGGWGGWPAG